MKLPLLEQLVCPGCFQAFTLMGARLVCAEVMEGRLACVGCGRVFEIAGGVPQLFLDPLAADVKKARTAESFGFLWSRTTDTTTHGGAHAAKTLTALSLPPPVGIVLDAGCGDGSDVAALAAHAAEVVGVEISDGGARAAFARTRALHNTHIIRADLCRLPFRAAHFAFVYSYGVLHHLPVPLHGLTELARVSQAGARGAIYVYEDFSERAAVLGWSLRAANMWRRITTRLPSRLLYGLCVAAAPLVYVGFSVPHRLLNRVPFCRPVAASLPYRHGRSPFDLTDDLYDRFSAPVEYRYSRHTAAQLARDAGFSVQQVQYQRGWMLELRREAVI